MKRLGILLATTLFSLACGTLPTVAQMPPQATQNAPTPQITATVADVLPTETKRAEVVILGDGTTWNIRTGPSLEYPALDIYATGGQEFIILSQSRGWVEVDAGWICGQAFGGSDECE